MSHIHKKGPTGELEDILGEERASKAPPPPRSIQPMKQPNFIIIPPGVGQAFHWIMEMTPVKKQALKNQGGGCTSLLQSWHSMGLQPTFVDG